MTQTVTENPRQTCEKILSAVGEVYVGPTSLTRKVLAAALANGHVLFEDAPGLGKTLLVKAFGRALGCHVQRVQFTPDLMPGDIVGSRVWEAQDGRFRLEKGPVFTNVLLADEINRAPPKAQSALLEAMEERQVTIEGSTMLLEAPFFVLATQNPLESEGTYPLPDAQMDRFLMRLQTGYARDAQEETLILKRRLGWKKDDPTVDIPAVTDAAEFRKLQHMAETQVFVHDEVLLYISHVIRALRKHPRLELGPSPRGGLALLRVSRALALTEGRNFVTPDDLRAVMVDCLAHRCIVRIDDALEGFRAEDAVAEVLARVPVPNRVQRGVA